MQENNPSAFRCALAFAAPTGSVVLKELRRWRRQVKFVLVNGRTPRPQSFCALCCEPIGESYLREIATKPPTAITSATRVI